MHIFLIFFSITISHECCLFFLRKRKKHGRATIFCISWRIKLSSVYKIFQFLLRFKCIQLIVHMYINFVRLSFPLSGWIKQSLNVCIKVHENREKNCIFNVKEKCILLQKKKDQENSSWKKVWKNLLCIFIYFWRGTRKTNGSTCTRQLNSTCEHLSKSCVPF